MNQLHIRALVGSSADRPVLVGFAPARELYRLSKADVLDEKTGQGYQRRFSSKHSLDFRRYIQRSGSTTIPLTFNLRPTSKKEWHLKKIAYGVVELVIEPNAGKILSQVDCQHRLGHVGDLTVSLPFMIFLELDSQTEMSVFNVINSKAKGLSGSLLDYHDTQLAADLARERPELLIALRLNDDPESPWRKQLDLGGNATSGMKRRASLRTMQKAVKRFLGQTKVVEKYSANEVAFVVVAYWCAVAELLYEAWESPRTHFITKGIGVYALMALLADIVNDEDLGILEYSKDYFITILADFLPHFDWTSRGSLKGLGGETGAYEALQLIRHARLKATHAKEIFGGK